MFATAAGDGWQVDACGPYDTDPTKNLICVAYQGNPDEAGVETRVDGLNAARLSDQESYTVHCMITAHVGTNNALELWATVNATFTACVAALKADRDLGGAVWSADVADHDWFTGFGETGVSVSVRVGIDVEAQQQ